MRMISSEQDPAEGEQKGGITSAGELLMKCEELFASLIELMCDYRDHPPPNHHHHHHHPHSPAYTRSLTHQIRAPTFSADAWSSAAKTSCSE